MTALAGGLVALVLGIIGIIGWWDEFIELAMGALPAMFILGGALAAYLGFEELKDKKTVESFEENTDDLKGEVESLREEIKELKQEKAEKEGSASGE